MAYALQRLRFLVESVAELDLCVISALCICIASISLFMVSYSIKHNPTFAPKVRRENTEGFSIS